MKKVKDDREYATEYDSWNGVWYVTGFATKDATWRFTADATEAIVEDIADDVTWRVTSNDIRFAIWRTLNAFL